VFQANTRVLLLLFACPATASKDPAQFDVFQPCPVRAALRGLTGDGEQLLVGAVLNYLAAAHNCM
jgi:hypothetical protein